MEEPSLGRKIYLLREERGLSQSKLEVEAGLSFGTLSRIENGVINPTKETIGKIAKVLNLLDDEYNYLFSTQKALPAETEVERIIKLYKDKLDSFDIPAYIMDCKFRVWYWNDMVIELLGLSNFKNLEEKRGMTIMKIMFSKEFAITRRIPKKLFPRILKQQIETYKKVVNKYRSEESVSREIRELCKDKVFNDIWKSKMDDVFLPIANEFYINYGDRSLSIDILSTFLNIDTRFILVSYYPKDNTTLDAYNDIRKVVEANRKKK